MKFYPNRGFISILSIIALSIFVYNFIAWLNTSSVLQLAISVILFIVFTFLLITILRSQTVEINDNQIFLIIFSRKIEVDKNDLYEIVVRNDKIMSYRFNSNNNFHQISPSGYSDSDQINAMLNKLLSKNIKSVNKV